MPESADGASPVRILHFLGALNPGGVETWLLNVLRHIDRERYQMDFLVHTEQPGAYDDEVRALGSEVISCAHPSRPLQFARSFRRVLEGHGPYDVVHSHVHLSSGYALRLAHQAGVPVRIAHSHSDTSRAQAAASLPRRAYLGLMKHWLSRHATCGLAVSDQAGAAMFGSGWGKDARWRTLPCGIDLDPFRQPVDAAALRGELGLPAQAFVVGHVGRFREMKNHRFLIEVAAGLLRLEPQMMLLLVGDGPLRAATEAQAAELGLSDRVVFAGLRSDVPRLLCGAMDAFVFPSLYEGLGLGLVEAQAAGLPCVAADVVPAEADVVPGLVRRLSLDAPAEDWAQAISEDHRRDAGMKREDAVAAVEASALSIRSSIAGLTQCYVRPNSNPGCC